MATITPVPSAEVLSSWKTIGDAREHYRINETEWAKLAAALGDETLDDMGMLAGVDDTDFRKARDEAGLNPLKKGVMNLLFGAIKTRFNLQTTIVQQLPTQPQTSTAATTSPPAAASSASTVAVITEPLLALTAEVKLGQVLNQALEQDIPLLPETLLRESRERYITICGDEPLQSSAATDAQLTALKSILDNGMVPYADFGVFAPHGTRLERRMKFTQHFMTTDGRWRATEINGPSTIEQWKSCWDVYVVAAISLGIATPASLARYAKRFEERCARYPRAWQVCARADDRCRSEWMQTEKRRQERFTAEHPQLSAVEQSMPWNTVFKEAADSLEYWLLELQEPAMLLNQSLTDTAAAQPGQDDYQSGKGKGRGKNKRPPPTQAHPTRAGKHYTTDQRGRPICIKFNHGYCTEECPRAHQCALCLGPHAMQECKRGKGGGGKKSRHTQYPATTGPQ